MAEGYENTGLKKFCTEITATTTSSGAVLIPSALRNEPILSMYYNAGTAGFIFRRDVGYFTCMYNNLTPVANTEVRFVVWYLAENALL